MNMANYGAGRYINLMFDLGFKRVFGKEANKDILITFLNEFIEDRQILDLEYLNVEKEGISCESKKSYFDVQCKTADGSTIIVEVQNSNQKYFKERVLYYSTLPILEQLERGGMYNLYPVYVVSILNFKLEHKNGEETGIVHSYSLREDNTGERMTDILHFIYIELGWFDKTLEMLENDREKWFFCLLHMDSFLERPSKMQAEIFKRLFDVSEVEALPAQERQQYIKEMGIERDILNQREFAREEGKAQGLEEGKAQGLEEGKIMIAKTMISRGMPFEDIVEITGLSESQVTDIENEANRGVPAK